MEFKKVMPGKVMCVYPWKAANEERKTTGGLIIPESVDKDKPNHLPVLLSGIDGIAPGDVVAFNRYHGTTVDINGQEYLFLKTEEILGVMDAIDESDAAKMNASVSNAP